MELKISHYLRVTPPIFDHKDKQLKLILFGTRKAEVRIIDKNTWDKINNHQFEKVPTSIRDDLINAEILVQKDEDELKTILDQNDHACFNNKQLYLVVQPTAACQLGCQYCGQHHTSHMMSKKDQSLFMARTEDKLKTKSYQHLEIGWFGAEPLLGIEVIRSFTPQLIDLANQYGIGYNAKMATNGMLLDHEMATELVVNHKINRLDITLDGPPEYHDKRRYTKKGKSSFETIFNNIIDLAKREDLEVKFTIRCNVDRRIRDGVIPLMQLLKEAGIHNRMSYLYFVLVHSWGNDADKDSPSKEEFAQWELEWFIKMLAMEFKVSLLPSRETITCMALQPDSELVDAYGNLFTCPEVSYVPSYEIPPGEISNALTNIYSIGHVRTGEIKNRRNILGEFNQKIREGQYPCHTCSILPVCGGVCPKQWVEGDIPCPPIKFNLEERLLVLYSLNRVDIRAFSKTTD